MDRPAPPPVTIVGGRGWVPDERGGADGPGQGGLGQGGLGQGGLSQDEPGQDQLGQDGGQPAPTSSRGRRALALLAAAAVGFGASQALTAWRLDTARPTADGTLSLEVRDVDPPVLRAVEDRPSLSLWVFLRNSGPVTITLEAAGLEGTGMDVESVAGTTVPAGATTRLVLTRSVDCGALPGGAAGGMLPGGDTVPAAEPPAVPLMVTARTPAGLQTVRLPLPTDTSGLLAGDERRACRLLSEPEPALQFDASVSLVSDGVGRLPLALVNSGAQDLLVTGVEPVDGLLLELLDSTGQPAVLPLRLPPADSGAAPDVPRQVPRQGPGGLTALFTTDCTSLPAEPAQRTRSLLTVSFQDEPGGPTQTAGYGDGDRLLGRLVDLTCAQADGARR